MATTNGLVTRAYINEVWDISLSKVVAVLRTHIVSRGNVILSLAEIISKALIIILLVKDFFSFYEKNIELV